MTDNDSGQPEEARGEEEVLGEIEVKVEPKEEELEKLGVTLDELSDAIEAALDKEERLYEDIENPDQVCPIEQIPVELKGKTYKLEEVADIEVTGDLDMLF